MHGTLQVGGDDRHTPLSALHCFNVAHVHKIVCRSRHFNIGTRATSTAGRLTPKQFATNMAANFWLSSHCRRWLFARDSPEAVWIDTVEACHEHRLLCVHFLSSAYRCRSGVQLL
jgi:hypothetical protein